MQAVAQARPGATHDILIIGAGVQGLSAALFLQRDGHRVTVVDPRDPGTATSFGNAGAVVTTSCAPLAMPGILSQVPKMLLERDGPLIVRWRYFPRLLPWLFDLLRASQPERVEEISIALAALNARAEDPWLELARHCGARDLLRPVGWLKVYEKSENFAATQAERDLMTRRGCRFEVMSTDELRQLEPNLAPHFRHGFFQPEAHFLLNPHAMVEHFAQTFRQAGGRILRETAEAIETTAEGRHRVVSDCGEHAADKVVVAAGAWSQRFFASLGVRPRLDTERGYHLMLPQPERGLGRPTVNGDSGFVLCPMQHGIRLASGVEFAGLAAPPDFRRIRGLLPLAQRMLPGLSAEERSAWLGYRPSVPDSLPVIGPAPKRPGVFCAFGHGHLGMTEGPVTGRLIADLIAGRDPGLDLAPYSPAR